MKKISKVLFRLVLIIAIVGGGILFFVSQQNNTSFTPRTIDLSVDCSQLDDLLVTKTVNVVVSNSSSRSHSDVSVRISAFDVNGTQIKEKYTTFQRTLGSNENFSKPVTLPARTQTCNCEVVSSNPF
jgi:hypothetical protein